MGMPHFYFHIRDRAKVILDEEGRDLEDAGIAGIEARASAVHMLADALDDGDGISHQVIEVTDSEGRVVASVAMRDVQREGPRSSH